MSLYLPKVLKTLRLSQAEYIIAEHLLLTQLHLKTLSFLGSPINLYLNKLTRTSPFPISDKAIVKLSIQKN